MENTNSSVVPRDAMSRMDEEESRRRYGTPRANDDVFKRIVDIRSHLTEINSLPQIISLLFLLFPV